MSASSDSRPWNIFGSDGSIEIEVELWAIQYANHILIV
jgi:hypothetical protein